MALLLTEEKIDLRAEVIQIFLPFQRAAEESFPPSNSVFRSPITEMYYGLWSVSVARILGFKAIITGVDYYGIRAFVRLGITAEGDYV